MPTKRELMGSGDVPMHVPRASNPRDEEPYVAPPSDYPVTIIDRPVYIPKGSNARELGPHNPAPSPTSSVKHSVFRETFRKLLLAESGR